MNWKSRPRVGMVQYASVSVSLAVARSEILSFLRKGEPCWKLGKAEISFSSSYKF